MVVEIIYSSGQYDRLGFCRGRRFEWNGPKRIRGDEIRLGEVFRQLRNPEKSDSINFSGSEYLERCEIKRLKKWSYTSYVLRFIQLSERPIGPKLGCGRLRVLRAFTSAMFECLWIRNAVGCIRGWGLVCMLECFLLLLSPVGLPSTTFGHFRPLWPLLATFGHFWLHLAPFGWDLQPGMRAGCAGGGRLCLWGAGASIHPWTHQRPFAHHAPTQ